MQGNSRFGEAILESRWPGGGIGTRDVLVGECIGRYAGSGDSWCFEYGTRGERHVGQGDTLESLARIHETVRSSHPSAGMVGYIAYELGYSMLGLNGPDHSDDTLSLPVTQFLFFKDLFFRHVEPQGLRNVQGTARRYSSSDLERLVQDPSVQARMSHESYRRAVTRIKEHIGDGDIYQANLTQAFDVRTARSGREIYANLAVRNPASFSAYLHFGKIGWRAVDCRSMEFPEIEVISCSPERFWQKTGTHVEARPIKGTIRRGHSRREDRQRVRDLIASPKDTAELLMITDLIRNDLGRCAEIGTVRTPALRRARACASVWHLESTVTGKIGPGVGWHEVMRSFFPGGSITGAPKRRAVEILRQLETVPRGVYCGAIGWVSASGDADFALAIRTIVKSGDSVRVHGGGGIVADSDPRSEYEESLLKIAPILECLCSNDSTATRREPRTCANGASL